MLHKVAYLKKCPQCGLHATVVLSDDSESESFASCEQGLAVVARLFALGQLQADEAHFLREQVSEAKLAGVELPTGLVGIIQILRDGSEPDEEQNERTLH